jgi:hypothetical protein
VLVQQYSGAANWSGISIYDNSLCDSPCIDSNGSVFHLLIDCATDTDIIIIIIMQIMLFSNVATDTYIF